MRPVPGEVTAHRFDIPRARDALPTAALRSSSFSMRPHPALWASTGSVGSVFFAADRRQAGERCSRHSSSGRSQRRVRGRGRRDSPRRRRKTTSFCVTAPALTRDQGSLSFVAAPFPSVALRLLRTAPLLVSHLFVSFAHLLPFGATVNPFRCPGKPGRGRPWSPELPAAHHLIGGGLLASPLSLISCPFPEHPYLFLTNHSILASAIRTGRARLGEGLTMRQGVIRSHECGCSDPGGTHDDVGVGPRGLGVGRLPRDCGRPLSGCMQPL